MSFLNLAIGGMSALNQYQQGRANNATAQAQAQSLDYQAQQEQQAALQQAAVIRRAARYTEASATTAFAGAGVKVGEGSAAEVSQQIYTDSEHDAMTAILTGTKRGNALRTQGAFARAQGALAAKQGAIGAAGTLLMAGASGYKGWVTGTQAPAPVETRNPFRGYGDKY